MQKILSGLDHLLLQQNPFKNARIALVTNNAAFTSGKERGRVALLQKGFNITKLFSPEHGLEAKGADGTYQSNSIDPLTQLPVISLYGDHLMPAAEDVEDIDMIVFDIPDVGCRFYTYLWTMTYVMEACALYNKPLVILDRCNPISGDMKKAEGPMLNEKCVSFIGRWNIPIRHSCTLGELATYFSATRKMNIDLTVIKLTGWERDCLPSENNSLFTPTSPAVLVDTLSTPTNYGAAMVQATTGAGTKTIASTGGQAALMNGIALAFNDPAGGGGSAVGAARSYLAQL